MPELPEIETLASQLRREISGFVFSQIEIRSPEIFGTPLQLLQEKIPGKKILGVKRRGKFLGLVLSGELSLWFHLGMTGQLLWKDEEADPHTHFIIKFDGTDKVLVFRDIRKFGKVVLSNGNPQKLPDSIRLLGPEPFELSVQQFAGLFKKRTGRIKSLLLNQRIVAGLGNIYADESLFRAGIDPRRRPNRLSYEKLAGLHQSICNTLKDAIDHGGSSIDDYVHTDGRRGDFQNFHRVYGRMKQLCFQCETPIRRIRLAGRSSFFCPQCQK